MHVTVLGASATYSSAGSPASGYLLTTDRVTLWVDAGSGTLGALQRHTALGNLSAVFVSHQHADHCVDLIGLMHALRYGTIDRAPLPVFAPSAVPEALGRFLDHDPDYFSDVLTFGDTPARLGDLSLTTAPTNHPVPTWALRAEAAGRAWVYTADTGPSDDVTRLAAGADVLFAEATYQGHDKPWPHHLTATEAGRLAADADVGTLVLTHIWPELDPTRSLDEAAAVFDGAIVLAAADMTIAV